MAQDRTPTAAACGRIPGDNGTWSKVESAAAQLTEALGASEGESWRCEQLDPALARCLLPLASARLEGLDYVFVLMIENDGEFGAQLDAATLVDSRAGEFAVVVTNLLATL